MWSTPCAPQCRVVYAGVAQCAFSIYPRHTSWMFFYLWTGVGNNSSVIVNSVTLYANIFTDLILFMQAFWLIFFSLFVLSAVVVSDMDKYTDGECTKPTWINTIWMHEIVVVIWIIDWCNYLLLLFMHEGINDKIHCLVSIKLIHSLSTTVDMWSNY